MDEGEIESPDDEETPAAPVASLTVSGATADGTSHLRISGAVEHASLPAVFRLRVDSGCAKDMKLTTLTTGVAFSLALAADELAAAFACAIDAEVGDVSLARITVAPDAASSAASGLTLDSAIGVADLEEASGPLVRFVVVADGAISDAHVTLGGTSYPSVIAPIDDGSDEAASAIFEVPARAWAAAVVTGGSARVDATLVNGQSRSLVVSPTVRVETSDTSEAEDCAG